ncbi:MAG TPA: HAD-IC family P-type ATPase, partial [Candidatus Limnocylindria bacterium]
APRFCVKMNAIEGSTQLTGSPQPVPAHAIAEAHGLPAADVAERLGVEPSRGLSSAEAAGRLAADGANELAAPKRPSLFASIWEAATEPFILLLATAGVLAIILGETRDGLLILVVTVPIVGADVWTSYRAERALDALRAAAAPRARVRRDGGPLEIGASEVVGGDVLLVGSGDVVAADARVLISHGAVLDRSSLTGESLPEPVSTTPDPPGTPLAERQSMFYAGTSVVGGSGEAVVVATGVGTEVGHISGALRPGDRRRSPVQAELDRLVRILLVVAAGLVAVTVGLGFLRGNPAGQNLLAGISAAIAAIPEEPPVLLAVILGLGAYRLLRRGVLVRRLSAQETLGAVDLILTDKTGTLTRNQLEVAAVITLDGELAPGKERTRLLIDALRAEADAWRGAQLGHMSSFPRALERALSAEAAQPILDPTQLVECEPPSDGHPYSLVSYRTQPDGLRELLIGAPEALLERMRTVPDAANATAWSQLMAREARTGRRLLLLAERNGDGPWRPAALIAFSDPVRADVPDAVRAATAAGIQTVMVTGDHPSTAIAIAETAAIPAGLVVTGSELAHWDDERLAAELADLHVVARATPGDKMRLVNAARDAQRTVAVTGDGVNDAPALQRADVAVAMGTGTAVAREASDLVLGDDSFATLMDGLREGRRIVANVQKGLVFLISTHVALLGFVLLGTLVGVSQPLLPIQILWAELFIDVSTSVAFEREPEEPGAMRRPPRPRMLPLLDRGVLIGMVLAGGFTATAALGLMQASDHSADHARWLAFTAVAVAQAVRAYANRSLVVPVTALPMNGFLLVAVTIVIVVQVLVPYVPPLAEAFRASPLSAGELALVAGVALAPAIVAQIARALGRRWIA